MQSDRLDTVAAIGLRATGQGLNERERQGRSSVAAAGVMQSDRRDTVAAIRLRATGQGDERPLLSCDRVWLSCTRPWRSLGLERYIV